MAAFDAKGRFCSSTFVPSYAAKKKKKMMKKERKEEKKDRGGAWGASCFFYFKADVASKFLLVFAVPEIWNKE